MIRIDTGNLQPEWGDRPGNAPHPLLDARPTRLPAVLRHLEVRRGELVEWWNTDRLPLLVELWPNTADADLDADDSWSVASRIGGLPIGMRTWRQIGWQELTGQHLDHLEPGDTRPTITDVELCDLLAERFDDVADLFR